MDFFDNGFVDGDEVEGVWGAKKLVLSFPGHCLVDYEGTFVILIRFMSEVMGPKFHPELEV